MRQKRIKEATYDNLIALSVLTRPVPIDFEDKEIFMELGSGKGLFITSMAKDFPDKMFIAVEKEINVCFRLAQRRQLLELKNLIIIMDDAAHIKEYLGEIKVKTLQLNFSDPWPKTKHHKRRLTYPPMLTLYKDLIAEDGLFIFRTDHEALFNDTLDYLKEANYQIISIDRNLKESKYMTEYEIKKRLIGPIYQVEGVPSR
ncbi:MAG TPA: tRNA (guanosine(46)-N7)-methyltransferase TrmB [Acholeplasma sp.]|jgi:tRNA (guanine-N7-)-methyltransferase